MGNSKRKRKNGAMPIRDGRFHGRSGLAPRLAPPPRGRAGNNVPLQVDFEQPGCKKTAVGTLCPLESFASTLSKAIDRTAMTTARYP